MKKSVLKKSFHEVFEKEPKIVGKTRSKKDMKIAQTQKSTIAPPKVRRVSR